MEQESSEVRSATVREGSWRLRAHHLGPAVPLAVGVYGLVVSHVISLGSLQRPGPGLWPFMVTWVVAATAALLWIMKKTGFEPGPLVLAFVLGPILERAFRQSMLISGGSLDIFVTRPSPAASSWSWDCS